MFPQQQQVPVGSGFMLQRWLIGSGGVCSGSVVSEGQRHRHLYPCRGNGHMQQEELNEVTEVTSCLISTFMVRIGGVRIGITGLCCLETSSPILIPSEVCGYKYRVVQVNCEKILHQLRIRPI